MPLESPIPTSIPNLNPLWPNGALGDTVNQGDNHLRYIKNALVTQLGSLGTAALTVTAAQINAAAASAGQVSTGTSTTSLLIGLGSKSFTTQAGRGFAVGQRVRLVSAANVANFMEGIVTAYDFATGAMAVNVDTIGGSGTYADWSVFVVVDVQQSLLEASFTAAGTITSDARGKIINLIGAFTLSFSAAATLGAGWYAILRNASNGDVVLDPNGAELIDGLTTYTLKPGWTIIAYSDGVGIKTSILKQRVYGGLIQVNATSTITTPADSYVLRAYVIGAGSAGTTTNGGAGGGMAYGDIAVTPGQSVSLNIAAGVAKVTVGGVDMLTGNPASGVTAGTASKNASVTNGGAFSGGAGTANSGGGSSGSPLGPGVAGASFAGGSGWGGAGTTGGGGSGGAGGTGRAGRSISESVPSLEPLLALLRGAAPSTGSSTGFDGGAGAGGSTGAAGLAGGQGGFGAGGGAGTGAAAIPGTGGVGGGGGSNTNTGGAGGLGGGGGHGAVTGGAGGNAVIFYFIGAV